MTAGWSRPLRALLSRPCCKPVDLPLEGLLALGDLGHPGFTATLADTVGEDFKKAGLVADDAEIQRPVTAEIFLHRMDAHGLDAGRQPVFVGAWHAVLADEDHEVGAEQRIGGCGEREAMVVREETARRSRGHDAKVGPLRCLLQCIPALALKHPLAGDDQRPLGFVEQRQYGIDILGAGQARESLRYLLLS